AEVDEFFSRPLHPYSIALLSAVFVPNPAVETRRRRIILTGDVPSPANVPIGCRFHTRCWLRERLGDPQECESIDPEERSFGANHAVACHFAEHLDGALEQAMVATAPPMRRPIADASTLISRAQQSPQSATDAPTIGMG
ncbi:MAG: oligopeptide/dipeptide ABC transporter ATP-binding protein, partial [Candidatus Limnocylindrales bacterium]